MLIWMTFGPIDQLQEIVIAAEVAIENSHKPWKLLWCIIEFKWSSQPELGRRLRKLLVLLLNQSDFSDFSVIVITVTLFLKLLAYDTQIQQLSPQLFASLPLHQVLKLSHFPLREVINELSSESLSVLKSFLSYEDEVVRVGSALLLKGVIKTLAHYRVVKTDEFQTLNDIRFDIQLGWRLVNSDENQHRLAGISILSLSEYPIEDINYQNRLLAILKQPQNVEEEEAWIDCLKEIPMSNKSTEWCELLKEILTQPWDYSDLVLNAVMERYSTLTRTVDVTISEADEKVLGLL